MYKGLKRTQFHGNCFVFWKHGLVLIFLREVSSSKRISWQVIDRSNKPNESKHSVFGARKPVRRGRKLRLPSTVPTHAHCQRYYLSRRLRLFTQHRQSNGHVLSCSEFNMTQTLQDLRTNVAIILASNPNGSKSHRQAAQTIAAQAAAGTSTFSPAASSAASQLWIK